MPKSISIPSDNRILRVPALQITGGAQLREGIIKAEHYISPIIEILDTMLERATSGIVTTEVALKQAIIQHFQNAIIVNLEIPFSGASLARESWGNYTGTTKQGWSAIPGTYNSVNSPFIRGWRFTAVNDIAVNAFRYRAYTASRTTHFRLWDVESQTILASASHFATAANIVYTTSVFPEVVPLIPGKDYIILADFTDAARYYYVTAALATSADISHVQGINSTADIDTYPNGTSSWSSCVDITYLNERESLYYASGNLELQSPVYSETPVVSSLFGLNATLPSNTSIDVSLDASFDGGDNWEGALPCVHGETVPYINGHILDNTLLKILATLTTTNPLVKPTLNSITLTANY